MELPLRLFTLGIGSTVLIVVLHSLIRKKMTESHTAMWVIIAAGVFIIGLFPGLIIHVAAFVGIYYQPSLLFLIAIIFLLLILFKTSLKISELEVKISEMAMEISIMKAKME